MADHKNITEREKAVIKYAVVFGITNRQVLYRLAYDGPSSQVDALVDLGALASRWYNSKKIQTFLQNEIKDHEIRRERIKDEIRQEMEAQLLEEGEKAKKGASVLIDYSDERNIIRKLNGLINAAKDDSEALDAIKTMAALLKSREELRKDKAEKPVRFYRPIDCREDCPFYQMADEVLRLRGGQIYKQLTPAMQAQTDAKIRAAGPEIVNRYFEKLLNHGKQEEA